MIAIAPLLLALLLTVTWSNFSFGGAVQTLPQEIRALLDKNFTGWRFATIIPGLRAQLPPDASPEWIKGDFDGDGQTDYVVQLVRPGPRDTAQVIVAFLRRNRGYQSFTLQTGGVHQGIYLRPSRKGEQGRDLAGNRSFINPHDVVWVLYGQEAGVTYLYEQGRFRKIVSGD